MGQRLLFIPLLLSFYLGWAQGITTSGLHGRVTDSQGEALANADVVAIHQPSGTAYKIVANYRGHFDLRNMRVGGPYTITVNFPGYVLLTYTSIFLVLGEPYTINIQMKAEAISSGEATIIKDKEHVLNRPKNGITTHISNREIQSLPAIDRSINDMIRITPQATSTAIGALGGGNRRQSYISVDGADFSNFFGTGSNLAGGGSPVSLDALEDIHVNISPFDVKQSGFIGSAINAITRSGTNEFSGSAYTFFRNENFQGNQVRGNEPFIRQDLKANIYGLRAGGPLVKNKLFFFLNAETGRTIRPGQQNSASYPAAPFGTSPNINRPEGSALNEIRNFLRETYNYDAGDFEQYNFVNDKTMFTGRIDWNINANHKFNIVYNQARNKSPEFMSASRRPMPEYPASTGRTSNNALWFSNSNYYQEANFNSVVMELNASYGRSSNSFRVSYTHQNEPRSADSKVFPFVDILSNGTPFTSFGFEPFSFGNVSDVKSFTISDDVSWSAGAHNFTVGGQVNLAIVKHGLQSFGTGYYTFNSWNEFINGGKPVDFAITYSLEPGFKNVYPKSKTVQYSIYGQGEFFISGNFKLTAGLRLDLPAYQKIGEMRTHPLVAGLTFAKGEKIDTGRMPDTKILWSPRIGFNWNIAEKHAICLSGGSGIFTGRVPAVWMVAQSADAGLLQYTQIFRTPTARNDPAFFVTPGPFNPDPAAYRPAVPPQPGTYIPTTMGAMASDFKLPQSWKTHIALDADLFWGLRGSLEGIYSQDINVALMQNPNLVQPESLAISGYPDNRLIYPNLVRDKFINPLTSSASANPNQPVANGDPVGSQPFNPIVLDNVSKGYYWSVTAKITKVFDKGFSGVIAYTWSEAKNVFDGDGDKLLASWSGTPVVNNTNDPELSDANYIVPNRVIVAASYRKEYLKIFATALSLFWEGSINGRFSYTYGSGTGTTGDINRDGQNNDLIYVPKDPSEITFAPQTVGEGLTALYYTPEAQSEAFFRYVEQDNYLRSRKGQYAERNGANMPWRNQLDVRFTQDIFFTTGGKRNTLQFTVDVFNVGNLLNKNWGTSGKVNAREILLPTAGSVSLLSPGGTTRPQFQLATNNRQLAAHTFSEENNSVSTYYMQAGLRYIFY